MNHKKLIMRNVSVFLFTFIVGVYAQGFIFFDDFNNNQYNWYQGGTGEYNYSIQNGCYVIDVFTNKTWTINRNVGLIPNENFTLEGTFRHASGISNNLFGLVWGFTNSNNYYAFGISDNGQFIYGKWVNGNFIAIQSWTSSNYINKYNSTNTLKVQHVNNMITFFINNNYVASANYEYTQGSDIGVVVTLPQRIEVDTLKVSRLIY